MAIRHLALLLVAPCLLGSQPSRSSTPMEARLAETVQSYEISKPDIARALIAIASKFQVPMGIEWIGSEPQHPVAMRWKTTTLSQIIASVVNVLPGYKLEVGANVLHVYYGGAKEDPGNFLNIRIGEVALEDVHVGLARRRLEQIVWDTVSPRASTVPGGPVSVGGSIPLDPNDIPKTFRWKNIEVRDALDELTVAGHYKVWVVSFPDSPVRTATGFRPTLSLWISRSGPNNLPSWDLFDWDHAPPDINTRDR